MPFDESLPALTPLQNAVRLVLFSFGFATYTKFEPWSAYIQAIVAQLKESLEPAYLVALGIPDLLLWAQFFGASISRLTKERRWFITRLSQTVCQLELKCVDEMEKVLGRFFYLAAFSRRTLLEIWAEVSPIAHANRTDLAKTS